MLSIHNATHPLVPSGPCLLFQSGSISSCGRPLSSKELCHSQLSGPQTQGTGSFEHTQVSIHLVESESLLQKQTTLTIAEVPSFPSEATASTCICPLLWPTFAQKKYEVRNIHKLLYWTKKNWNQRLNLITVCHNLIYRRWVCLYTGQTHRVNTFCCYFSYLYSFHSTLISIIWRESFKYGSQFTATFLHCYLELSSSCQQVSLDSERRYKMIPAREMH